MKQCRECGTLSYDDTDFCYICGAKFNDCEKGSSEYLAVESVSEDHRLEKHIPEVTEIDSGEMRIRFDGIYQYKYPDYSSYLRFIADGKVVEVVSTGIPSQVGQWLNHERERFGYYTIQDGIVSFTITGSTGKVSYAGKILKDAIEINVISHINGYSANNLRYSFCSQSGFNSGSNHCFLQVLFPESCRMKM